MTIKTRKQIQLILAGLDAAFGNEMIAATKGEELFEKKYNLSDWIYCLYANDEKTVNDNPDHKNWTGWVIEQFYGTKENIPYWDKNWTFDENSIIYAKRYGKFYISKSGSFKLVSAEDFISSAESDNHKHYIDLRIKRFEISNNAWFYFRGNKYLGTAFLTRLYFNFNYHFRDIVSFSKALCNELNDWNIPFEYKFATKETQRFDNGVLYTNREHYFIVFYLVSRLANERKYSRLFGTGKLAFTYETALKGISFGEEPPVRNTSFGRYRADIMADIYIDYYREIQYQKQNLHSFFLGKLSKKGFSIDEFFRNPHSHYPYDFSIFKKKGLLLNKKSAIQHDTILVWALNIGKLICKQAIITQQENKTNCYWFSMIEDEHGLEDYRLIDNSFEEGRLGIIYFLSKLYEWFPEEYLFRFICESVLKSMLLDKVLKENAHAEHIIADIKATLKSTKSRKIKKTSHTTDEHPLVNEITDIISNTKSYSNLSDEAPQPIVKNGYTSIGLILLAIHKNDFSSIKYYEDYYNKQALLKLINHILF